MKVGLHVTGELGFESINLFPTKISTDDQIVVCGFESADALLQDGILNTAFVT